MFNEKLHHNSADINRKLAIVWRCLQSKMAQRKNETCVKETEYTRGTQISYVKIRTTRLRAVRKSRHNTITFITLEINFNLWTVFHFSSLTLMELLHARTRGYVHDNCVDRYFMLALTKHSNIICTTTGWEREGGGQLHIFHPGVQSIVSIFWCMKKIVDVFHKNK